MNVRVLLIGALIVAAVLRPTGSATGNQQDGAQARPRLIVMIVVDQMRADYLDVFANRWKHGFATLRSEGTVFDRAKYHYEHRHVSGARHDWHRHVSACPRDDPQWLVGSHTARAGQLHRRCVIAGHQLWRANKVNLQRPVASCPDVRR